MIFRTPSSTGRPTGPYIPPIRSILSLGQSIQHAAVQFRRTQRRNRPKCSHCRPQRRNRPKCSHCRPQYPIDPRPLNRANQCIMTVVQIAMDQAFDRHFGSVQQPTSPPPPTQSNSLVKKKKRNQRTRQQYKKKAHTQAQHVLIPVQEVDHKQEVELVQISVEKPSKHVVLQLWNWVATSPQHATVIP